MFTHVPLDQIMDSNTLGMQLDPATKLEFTKICEVLGYSTSQAIDLCVKVAIASGNIPSEPDKEPNEITLAAMQELEEGKGTKVKSTVELFRNSGFDEELLDRLIGN